MLFSGNKDKEVLHNRSSDIQAKKSGFYQNDTDENRLSSRNFNILFDGSQVLINFRLLTRKWYTLQKMQFQCTWPQI